MAVWSGDNISMLQKLQDRFCHHVTLPPVQARLNYLTLLLFYKIKNKLSPLYLQRLLPQACGMSSRYHLCGLKFPVPTVRSSRALKTFLPRSIFLWNNLPPGIQALRTVASFKAALKNHLKLYIRILLYLYQISFFVFHFFTLLLFLFLLSFSSICIFYVWSFCTNNAQAPSLFSNVTLTSRRS